MVVVDRPRFGCDSNARTKIYAYPSAARNIGQRDVNTNVEAWKLERWRKRNRIICDCCKRKLSAALEAAPDSQGVDRD